MSELCDVWIMSQWSCYLKKDWHCSLESVKWVTGIGNRIELNCIFAITLAANVHITSCCVKDELYTVHLMWYIVLPYRLFWGQPAYSTISDYSLFFLYSMHTNHKFGHQNYMGVFSFNVATHLFQKVLVLFFFF